MAPTAGNGGPVETIALDVWGASEMTTRVVLDERTLLVGRGSECAVVLADPYVSRRQLEVSVSGGGVSVRKCPGAVPLRVNGREVDAAVAQIGDVIQVGFSSLLVTTGDAPSRTAPLRGLDRDPETLSLTSGPANEARRWIAIDALAGALEQATDRDSALARLRDWARLHVGASTLDAVDAPREARGAARADVEEQTGDGLALVVPAGRIVASPLRFHFESDRARTSAPRRLLVLASTLWAATSARLEAERIVREDDIQQHQRATGNGQGFLGESPAGQRIARLVSRLASSAATVLLLGESGAGKSFLARLLHESSDRAREPFRVVNCAAVPENLIESELFGHERGAFPGATSARIGAFEAAGAGTIFLDEVAELPLVSQAKVLRAIEERKLERLGSTSSRTIEARIIAATNRNLSALVASGAFREDLYYRISVVRVDVPSLRDREADFSPLAHQILADVAEKAGRRVVGFTAPALKAMRRYPWPGNARELRNVLEAAVVLGDGTQVAIDDLPPAIRGESLPEGVAAVDPVADDPFLVRLPTDLASLETKAIQAALRATNGNRTRTAEQLGICRVTLYKKLRAMSAASIPE